MRESEKPDSQRAESDSTVREHSMREDSGREHSAQEQSAQGDSSVAAAESLSGSRGSRLKARGLGFFQTGMDRLSISIKRFTGAQDRQQPPSDGAPASPPKSPLGGILARFQGFSLREKSLVVLALGVIAILLLDKAYTPISEAFTSQQERLAELERNAKAAPFVTERYAKLRARREQLEARFQQIEFKEGALSYIENLVRTEALIGSGFDIKEGSPRSFGPTYEQVPFSVRFASTNPPALVNFLSAAVRGERPLLMTRLDIQKPRRGDRLDVDIELNSIRSTTRNVAEVSQAGESQ